MKHKYISALMALPFVGLSASFGYGATDKVIVCNYVAESPKVALTRTYRKFESSVAERDKAGLIDTFLFKSIAINIVERGGKGPVYYSPRSGTGMANYIGTNGDEYRLVISDVKFHILDNVAISLAHFEEFVRGENVGFGEDLFTFVKTLNGWKIALTNNSFTYKSATIEYGDGWKMLDTIGNLIKRLETALNTGDEAEFEREFAKRIGQFYKFDQALCEGNYDKKSHGYKAYFEKFTALEGQAEYKILAPKIEIIDDFLALVTSQYEISIDSQTIEIGQQFMTLMANQKGQWKITAILQN